MKSKRKNNKQNEINKTAKNSHMEFWDKKIHWLCKVIGYQIIKQRSHKL